jgi:bifunctional non-homologous end joining protein LigD
MSLVKYKSKRNLEESPEPSGGEADRSGLRFVIQKHDASHLHYDFRLEMGGVLKSWAIPKGPSTDPSIRRLAVMVEDHPYDYRNFEGVIPSGYGAGTVLIWDQGFYEPKDFQGLNKEKQEKKLRKELRAGKITVTLQGKKLKGDYGLIRAKNRGENNWLFFKIKDKFTSTKDITHKDKSVISMKNIRQIGKTVLNKEKSSGSKISVKKKTSEQHRHVIVY